MVAKDLAIPLLQDEEKREFRRAMKESFLGVVLPLEAARAKACRVIGSCSNLPLLPHWRPVVETRQRESLHSPALHSWLQL